MNIFKRKEEVVDPVITEPDNEIMVVEMKDIRAYLVDEFEYVKELEEQIEETRAIFTERDNLKQAHSASLILLDEYKRRIDKLELDNKGLQERVTESVRATELERDKENQLRLAVRKYRDDAIDVIRLYSDGLGKAFLKRTGTLTKQAASDFARDYKDSDEWKRTMKVPE
ncbi:MAG: hypothetical protein HGA54_00855 [Actinobacteria bacterium]|nr:hypothetical protein [Actinomycetota bacterium]